MTDTPTFQRRVSDGGQEMYSKVHPIHAILQIPFLSPHLSQTGVIIYSPSLQMDISTGLGFGAASSSARISNLVQPMQVGGKCVDFWSCTYE